MKSQQQKRPAPTSPSRRVAAPGTDLAQSNQEAMANLESVQVDSPAAAPGPAFAASVASPPPPMLWVEILRTAPTSGSVCDLAGGSPLQAGVDWVKIDAGGPLWIHLSALSADQQTTLLGLLGAARGTFSLSASGRLVLGQEWTETFVSADAKDGQKVLDDALGRDEDSEVFDFLNGGEDVLQASQASAASKEGWASGQKKPGSWYNYYEEVDGQVGSHASRFDERNPTAPDLDPEDQLKGLKELIMRCLDISGLKAAVGDDIETFETVMTERFALSANLSESAFGDVLAELWSYLQTGTGRDGSVDIGRLQALVRALDPQIRLTSETNTPFDGASFDVGDSKLARGDGHFGRATMLSLLHLFGQLETHVHPPGEVGTTPGNLFGRDDYFVRDDSDSMMNVMAGQTVAKWPTVVGAVDASMGLSSTTGIASRTVGTMDEAAAEVGGQTVDIAECLERAWVTLQTEGVDEAGFAALLGLGRRDVFPLSGAPNWEAVMDLLGDGSGNTLGSASPLGGRGESPIKAMLQALTHPGDLSGALAQRVQLGSADTNTDPVRLNGVMDESFQALEYLGLVRELATALNVDIRFIVVPGQADAYVAAPVSQLVFVDPAQILLHPTTHEATVTWVQNGVSSTDTFELDRSGPTPSATDANRYRGASLDIDGMQGVRGRTR